MALPCDQLRGPSAYGHSDEDVTLALRAGVARRDAGGGSGAMSKGTGESMPVEPSAELVEQGTP